VKHDQRLNKTFHQQLLPFITPTGISHRKFSTISLNGTIFSFIQSLTVLHILFTSKMFISMKKTLLLMMAFAFVGTAAMAQLEQKDYKKEKTEWDNKVKDELKLSADQVAKYEALNKEYEDKFNVIANDASLDKDAQKEKKMALKKEKEAKLFEFLTPEQQTKYRELIDRKKKEMEKPANG
jgi:PhoPQ-activated pathogenicity-related protein